MLALTTGIAQIILALIYISAARSTSPSNYGTVITAIALGSSAVGFIDFGTNSYWIRELAKAELNRVELSNRMTSKLAIAFILAIVWIALVLITMHGSMLWMAGPIAFALIANQSLQVPLRGIARNDLVSLNVLTDKVVAGLVYLALALAGVEAVSRLWIALSFGAITAAFFGWLWTPEKLRPSFRFRVRTNPWRGSGHYGVSTLAISAQTLDLPILAVVAGPFAAGVYGAVNRWTQPMGLLSSAFVSASLPFMAKAHSFKEGLVLVKKGLWLPALAVLGCVAILVCAPLIVVLFLGESYTGSVVVLQALAVATMVGIINQPLVVFLQARGYDRPVAWLMGCTVAMQLCLVALLGSRFGSIGAALAIIALQTMLFICSMVLVVIIWKRDAQQNYASASSSLQTDS